MAEKMKHGEQAALARKVGITPRHMNDIIKGRRRPSAELSIKLEEETGIERSSWLFPDKYPNRLLRPSGAPNGTED